MKDYGHYMAEALPSGEDVITVHAGESLEDVFILSRDSDKLPYRSIIAERDSNIRLCIVILPGVTADVSLQLYFEGENSEAVLSGVYLCSGNEKVNISTKVLHRTGKCRSTQLFNGIAGGTSHAGFYGTITVAPDAEKTEAYQSNHNLLVSDKAKADTKPQLEIYADDVKCSHGATVGSLNADEQFYMRSRGIPEEEAKVLQMISFTAPVLKNITDAAKREETAELIERHIRAI